MDVFKDNSHKVRQDLDPKKPLTSAQVSAAYMDATGANDADIAAALGVQKGTLKRWRDLEKYQAEVHSITSFIKTKALDLVMPKMVEVVDATLDALIQIVSNPLNDASLRLEAADRVLTRVMPHFVGEREAGYEPQTLSGSQMLMLPAQEIVDAEVVQPPTPTLEA